ncbi:hypothetical protein [Maridesulfovibrio ferrireducens]|uniref:hypothetical protein n=1 Tax=Maridesulfovibrio ferrireducens TaxID=246191 RepID=UPI001A344849|nr:hypothetical protein [Maridesulfovibrio ferrireducens]MBI9113258.1 hypothetical protein [Maridesulfovibrio ferrireducens]
MNKNYSPDLAGIAQAFAYGADKITSSNIMLAAIQLAGDESPTQEHIDQAHKIFKMAFAKSETQLAANRKNSKGKLQHK